MSNMSNMRKRDEVKKIRKKLRKGLTSLNENENMTLSTKRVLKNDFKNLDEIQRKAFMKKNRVFHFNLACLAWAFLLFVPSSKVLADSSSGGGGGPSGVTESLPSGLKANLVVKLPKNTGNLSEGYELAEQSNVAVTLRLLSPNACVLVSETQTRNIVKGSLNVVLGANPLTSESFQSFGNLTGSNKLEKFQKAFSNSTAITGLTTCYQSLSQFTLHESHNSYTPGPQDTRYLMVEFTVTNKASQVIPIKLATSLGVTPYSHLASKARVAESLSQPISNAQLSEEEFSVSKIPSLDASKIVTGVLGLDRIPALTGAKIPFLDASHVTTGSFSVDRLPSPLNGSGCSDGKILKRQGGAWVCGDESGIGTESDPTVQGFAKQAPSGDDFSFTGGGGLQLKVTGVDPSYSYSKITVDAKGRVLSGSALSASDIPDLDGAKISSGTISYSRLPVGQSANTVAAGNDPRFLDARSPSGNAGGDLGGSYPNPVVTKIQNQQVSASVPQEGQILVKDSTQWVPQYIGITHLKTMMGTPQMGSVGCTASQSLSWSSVTDLLTCVDISIAHTQVTGLGSLATASQVNLSSQVTGSLALTSLASSGASANQILRWNGTQWSPSAETAASWSSVTGKPTTLSGYGITDGLSSSLTSAQIRVGNSSNLATAVSLSGDATLSNTGALTLANSGVTAGTYPKVTVDAKGRVTIGTTLAASDIPNLDAAKITTGVVDSARLPVASDTVSGLVNTLAQSFAGVKTFLGNLVVKAGAKLLVTNSSDQVRIELDGATGQLLVKNSTGSSNTVTLSGDTGNITTTGGITADRIQLGNSSTVCNTTNEGSLRYNAQAKKFEGCDGTSWANVSNDPCLAANPALGTLCNDGSYYIGQIAGSKYFTTPGNCAEVPSPNRSGTCPGSNCYPTADFTATCLGGTDTLTKFWNNGTGNWFDISGIVNYTSTEGVGHWSSNIDVNTGLYNTNQIVAITSSSQGGFHAAGRYCDRMVFGGQSDWYLPNRFELDLLRQLGSSLQSTLGVNTEGDWYWSSSEYSSMYAWVQKFSDGNQFIFPSGYGKAVSNRLRCMRKTP
jgi:hypothetical protein